MSLGLVAGLLAPAQAAPPQPDVPVFSSEVALVLLAGVRGGSTTARAARGLRAEDFEPVRGRQARRRRRVPVRGHHVARGPGGDPRRRRPRRRRFLLLYDQSFTDPTGCAARSRRASTSCARAWRRGATWRRWRRSTSTAGCAWSRTSPRTGPCWSTPVETLGVSTLAHIGDPHGARAGHGRPLDTRIGRAGSDSNAALDVGGLQTVLINQMRAAEAVRLPAEHRGTAWARWRTWRRRCAGWRDESRCCYFSAGFDSRLLTGQTGESSGRPRSRPRPGALREIDGATRFGDSRLRERVLEMTRQSHEPPDTGDPHHRRDRPGADDSMDRMYANLDFQPPGERTRAAGPAHGRDRRPLLRTRTRSSRRCARCWT